MIRNIQTTVMSALSLNKISAGVYFDCLLLFPKYLNLMIIRRLVTMAESIDVKAGIKSVLERIDVASKNRSEQVI